MLTDVAGDLTEAYETQSRAMEVLHDSMTAALSKGFATIDGTPLADPEFAGFSPSFGTGGPSLEIASDHHVFERFQDRSDRLMTHVEVRCFHNYRSTTKYDTGIFFNLSH